MREATSCQSLAIGMSYGWGIYYNHQEYNKPYWLAVQPMDNLKGQAFTFAYRY